MNYKRRTDDRFLSVFVYGLVVETVIDQAALLAQGLLWAADLSTVTNDVDVNFIEAPFGNQTEPPGYAKYVSVYRKDGAVAGEQ